MDAFDDADDRWERWRQARPEPSGIHLDSAAAGRSSYAVLAATSDHALAEATSGAYVAQEGAAAALSSARTAVARLLGVPGDGVAFVESASVALHVLLEVWPLRPDPTIGIVKSEWGPNLAAFARRGLRMVELPVEDDGVVDLTGVGHLLSSAPPDAVHVTQVASHRPLVQPVAALATLCRSAGVPLFVDAAQALGHVDTATGADVVYATSRKWLAGPRGVGVLAVAAPWFEPIRRVLLARGLGDAEESVGQVLTSKEAHVAGRIGLGVAARELLDLEPSAVFSRLGAVGRATREALGDLDSWRVLGAAGAPSAISALAPTAGQDVTEERARLLHQHGIVTTAQLPFRAPRDMARPTLRVSPHLDVTTEQLHRLRLALESR